MSRLSRRITVGVLLIIVLLVIISVTSKERKNLTLPEKVLRDSLAPLQMGVTTVTTGFGNFFDNIAAYMHLRQDNQKLTKQVADLQQKVGKLKEIQYENIRLREALGYAKATADKFDLEPAEVIARDPRNWFSMLTINRGSADGIKKDMPVITQKGLVGRVLTVSNHTASVLLILDNRSAVGGLIDINNTPGVIEGINDKAGFIRMIHIPRDTVVKAKQKVITSGLGSLFPKGLAIGEIIESSMEANGLLKYAIIRPAVDFDRLDNVFVIKNVSKAPQAGTEEVVK